MFEFDRDGQAGILRIGHSLRRTPQLIQAEVDWINYLAEGGAGVARALFSGRGSLVEAVDDRQGEQFLVTAFARAPGGHVRQADWTPAFLEAYGQLIGRMHALSRKYTPPHPDCVRYHWDDDANMVVAEFLPREDTVIAGHFEALLASLKALPVDPEGYGMIHQDAHSGNFFLDETGCLTLFDFDDCCFGHYIYDLAMVVFYAIIGRSNMVNATQELLVPFLHGYRRENRLDPAWLKQIPPFLKLREIDLYAVIHRSLGPGPYEDNPWVQRFMSGRRERLLADLPVVDIDFQTFEKNIV
jgi:Ser/Thr protein kinase RdoA (MazF antagonist)